MNRANFEEQYFLNRRDRYWIVNDCEELCNYLEDVIDSFLASSDTSDYTAGSNKPFGEKNQVKWNTRFEGAKKQERMLSYMVHEKTKAANSAGEIGVVESKSYNLKAIKPESASHTSDGKGMLQIVGQEATKEK